MELNIDFDEFKKHIQNRENAKVLLGANSILMFPYRIFGDILFEKNKITISLVQAGSASPTYIFKRTEFKNTISVNFKPTKIFNINSIMFGIPSILIILYLFFVSFPLIGKVIFASVFPFIWIMIYGAQFLQREVLCKRIKENWGNRN